MNDAARERFDALLEEIIEELPRRIRDLLDDVPVIVDDRPSRAILLDLGIPEADHAEETKLICGLHTGIAITERSVEDHPDVPEHIHLFRVGITHEAGGPGCDDESLAEEIRITLLHEIGHHFGLDEDDLADLGYN